MTFIGNGCRFYLTKFYIAGYTAGYKLLVTLKKKNFSCKYLKGSAPFLKQKKRKLWAVENKMNLNQNDGKRKVWKRKGTA